MEYRIKKGDIFLCLDDYIMDNESILYTKGKTYQSDSDGCITDDEFDILHGMLEQDNFFEYFKLITKP